jgi:hypothetical protein
MESMKSLAAVLLLAMSTGAVAADYVASGSRPYLREAPSSGADAKRRLDSREPVSIRDREGRWVRISTGRGDSGWVRASEIRRTW